MLENTEAGLVLQNLTLPRSHLRWTAVSWLWSHLHVNPPYPAVDPFRALTNKILIPLFRVWWSEAATDAQLFPPPQNIGERQIQMHRLETTALVGFHRSNRKHNTECRINLSVSDRLLKCVVYVAPFGLNQGVNNVAHMQRQKISFPTICGCFGAGGGGLGGGGGRGVGVVAGVWHCTMTLFGVV